MPLTFEWDPSLDHRLRDGLRALWADVAEAGGADGLAAPVSAEDLRADLLNHLAAVDAGSTRMLIGRDERGAVAASAFLAFNAHRPKRHWCSVYTVMVHPALQGRGYGRELMSAVEQGARGIDGITALRISCRGGL
ncbi:MAG: GNAT family N-acetyltransferase, partial [Streptomyces sp.]